MICHADIHSAPKFDCSLIIYIYNKNEVFSSSFNLILFFYIFFQNEKTLLHTHRSAMLRLNASVHTWLTQQERKRAENAGKQQQIDSVTTAMASNSISNGETSDINSNAKETSTQSIVDDEFHKQLKNEVGNMYSVWEEADQR